MPHFARSNGVSLHYETSGTGPLDLLFMHGWGGSARFWDPFIAQHANFPGSRRVCLSFRGHGDSEKPQEGYSVSELAREGLDVLDAIGSVRTVVIGFSMGGKIAPYCGMMDPRRIVGQVLVAPAGPARIEIPREMIEEYLEAASDPQQIRKLFRPWMKEEPEERVYDRFIEDLVQTPRFVLEKTIRMVTQTSITAELQNTEIPTTIVCGSADPFYGPEYQRSQVLPFFPGADLVIAEAGHFIPMEKPGVLSKAIHQILRKVG